MSTSYDGVGDINLAGGGKFGKIKGATTSTYNYDKPAIESYGHISLFGGATNGPRIYFYYNWAIGALTANKLSFYYGNNPENST